MKKILITFLLTLVSLIVSAQSESVATLIHEGEITSFYGFNAFVDANKAATDGDVITLSKGTFKSSDITKSITIRGAGCFNSSQLNIENTIIAGSVDIVGENLCIEGIFFNDGAVLGDYSVVGMKNSRIIKCYFRGSISCYSSYVRNNNNFFSHCYFSELSSVYGENTFISCVANFNNSNSECVYNFINCVLIHNRNGYNDVRYSTFRNCIFLNLDGAYNKMDISYGSTAYNSISIGGNTDLFSDQVVTTNKVVDLPLSSIFKTYDGGELSLSQRFELTESAAAAYLGGDGTQVGIYGGDYPFTSEVGYPVISKFEASSKTDADGKIKVSVEVKTPQ